MKFAGLKATQNAGIIVLLLFASAVLNAQAVQFKLVPPGVIEDRLAQYAGTDRQREITLKQMFMQSGCDGPNLLEQPVKGTKLPNLICKFPGETDRTIIVGAHFDHVSAGSGVVDNWSGASLLPSLYEALKVAPRKHTYIFIAFTDEEDGEVGSRYYAKGMTKSDVDSTDAMVNMDTLGIAPTEVWASHSDRQLANTIAYVAKQLNLPVSAVNVDEVGSTDSEQFAARHIPSITIHSLTQEAFNARILHTSNDKLSAIKKKEYYDSYKLISAFIAVLDGRDRTARPK